MLRNDHISVAREREEPVKVAEKRSKSWEDQTNAV